MTFGGDELGQGADVVLWGAEPAAVPCADPSDPVRPAHRAGAAGSAQAEFRSVTSAPSITAGVAKALSWRAPRSPCLLPFRGAAVVRLGDGSRLVERAFDLLDGSAVAGCVAGGVADQALAAEDPGGDGERLDRHWARFSPRLRVPAEWAAWVWWCSSAA